MCLTHDMYLEAQRQEATRRDEEKDEPSDKFGKNEKRQSQSIADIAVLAAGGSATSPANSFARKSQVGTSPGGGVTRTR